MFGKIAEAQKKAEEIKQRLATISVTGKAANGSVTVICDGNKKVLSVQIAPELCSAEQQPQLQQFVLEATNDALQQADQVSSAEMKSLMSSMLPGLGGLFGK
ncbi:MAG: YbaB/EbfC family nucleoid-associated protein [Bacteroidia bacterium]|jgi:hypothetical protein|nr:YbaB/EbfC family nucleoid-associated protein [Bacteroidia bacterium]